MKNSNLLEIFRTFSVKEIKEFKYFVTSPYFNKSESVILLFEHIKKHYPEFPEDKIEKEYVYSRIFKGAEYNDGFMRKVMHSLFQLAENYISISGFTSNSRAVNDMLLQQYFTRNSSSLFIKTWKNTIPSSEKNELMGSEQFYYSYLSSYRYLAYGAEHKNVDFIKFAGKNDLLEPFEYLQGHYYSSAMNLYEYYLNTQRMARFEIDDSYFESIFNSFDQKVISKYPLLKMHYNMIKMLKEPLNEDYFFENKKLLLENKSPIAPIDLENIYINMQNYCMRKIRANREEYSRELFEIYKMELANNEYSAEKHISVILYRNIVFTSLQISETEFAVNFAEKYKEYLPEDGISNYYYVKAHIFLKKGEFEEIGKYLSRIKSADEMLKADIKSMYILLYYETEAYDQLYSIIDTFRHFLKKNTGLSDERKNVYGLFVNLSARLAGIKENFSLEKLHRLKTEITGTENLINKKWLLEKIAELEAK